MNNLIIDVTESSFENDVLQEKGLVMVEFWATWCPHCQYMIPIVEDIANQYQGQVSFCRIDIDKNPTITQQFDIDGTPTFFLFKNATIVGEETGELSKEELSSLIKDHL